MFLLFTFLAEKKKKVAQLIYSLANSLNNENAGISLLFRFDVRFCQVTSD